MMSLGRESASNCRPSVALAAWRHSRSPSESDRPIRRRIASSSSTTTIWAAWLAVRRLPCNQVVDDVDQVVRVEGLCDGCGGPQLAAGIIGAVSGQHQHRLHEPARAYLSIEGAAVHIGHLQVQDDAVEA